MASETPDLGLSPARALGARTRAQVVDFGRKLLRFHASLERFPGRASVAPRATPIVAAYVGGTMAGCAIGREPTGGKSLARGFLSALATVGARADVAVDVTYRVGARRVASVADVVLGEEGVALVPALGPAVLLMPAVARDHRVDHGGLEALLRDKARRARPDLVPTEMEHAAIWAWPAVSIAVRRERTEDYALSAEVESGATPSDIAAAWLARLVGPDGSVAFAIDPRARILAERGELHHARSAFAIEALARHGAHRREVGRARVWLGRELETALRGGRVSSWPTEGHGAAATVALACLAGVRAEEALAILLRSSDVADALAHDTWRGAQVCLALGASAPPELWSACAKDLARRPFAPFTALAARARGDTSTLARATEGLIHALDRSPSGGGVGVTRVAETGLTAVTVTALSETHPEHAARALAFVKARHRLAGRIPAALDPTLALGGFAGSPIDDVLRADTAGHALTAMLAVGSVRRR